MKQKKTSFNKKNRVLREKPYLVKGIIKRHSEGFGFVIPEDKEHSDIYIPSTQIGSALSQDKVEVLVYKTRGPRAVVGLVQSILKRDKIFVTGFIEIKRDQVFITRHNLGFSQSLPLTYSKFKKFKEGDYVRARILYQTQDLEPSKKQKRTTKQLALQDSKASKKQRRTTKQPVLNEKDLDFESSVFPFQIELSDNLGSMSGSAKEDRKRVMAEYELAFDFNEEVEQQANSFPNEVRKKDFEERKDLREKAFITIDGETAKDFDDAILVEKKAGGYKLYVAIADVSYYVTEGSPLDESAFQRGNSTYFPDFCIPMLPEKLSNGLCSLKEQEDRLVMVQEMDFDLKGGLVQSQVYPSVIRSKKRLTYNQVESFLEEDSRKSEDTQLKSSSQVESFLEEDSRKSEDTQLKATSQVESFSEEDSRKSEDTQLKATSQIESFSEEDSRKSEDTQLKSSSQVESFSEEDSRKSEDTQLKATSQVESVSEEGKFSQSELKKGIRTPNNPDYFESLKHAKSLTQILIQKHKRNQGFDLDIPETRVILDNEGETTSLLKEKRLFSHKMIEHFMLACNQAVSFFLEQYHVPFIYRVHESPKKTKLMSLEMFAKSLSFSKSVKSREEILYFLNHHIDHKRVHLIHKLFLRSMSQARYSGFNQGHYGLNYKLYTHFTSPIRRYSDLLIHRLVKKTLDHKVQLTPSHKEGEGFALDQMTQKKKRKNQKFKSKALLVNKQKRTQEELEKKASWLSAREQKSVKAERRIKDIKLARYLKAHVGETCLGFVSSVVPFGMFITLEDFFVEGLVRFQDMKGYWELDELGLRVVNRKTNYQIKFGDSVEVLVKSACPETGQIDLKLERHFLRTAKHSKPKVKVFQS